MTTITGNDYAALGLGQQQTTRSSALGQADFLHLMTEQLKNQDPLKPLDNNQFLGQLAQFSTVQGIEGMQGAMTAMASVMESDQTLRAATLVGHDAMVSVDTVPLAQGAGLRGEVVAQAAGPVTLDVVDANGVRVRRMTVEATADGIATFDWDGRDQAGNTVAAGNYSFRAVTGTADPSAGDANLLPIRASARVDSVSIEPGGLFLNLAGMGSVPLSAVHRIG
ncbi:flagellar hook capping FlgD N-terminal domain-containing protein [uncultured Luteimonas sp.]|uniref:flagellar hook assembly protein FlgD n=1 Tax=uncultured Luteimonas sp. TaxID=453144 RepID=UPI002635F3E0|nr:flagellar hook capping FlgD N-terminal domain-containing protein [uncultured Luteimonas sp.]